MITLLFRIDLIYGMVFSGGVRSQCQTNDSWIVFTCLFVLSSNKFTYT